MDYTKVDYTEVEPVADSLYFLREPLGCENLGVSVLECEPGWSGKEHDHAEEDHEEVYLLVEGEATIVVDGESVLMEAGEAVRIPAEATRRIENGETESRFVLAGAP
ncbi:cupin domain-containing protein [Halalkalicoccus jeotgali]|uniref:Cupin 2 barrel domain-containing protein n=1 Tax=Halalkalicoccus jeotgali (strain DSM 18796 / CECT 7217 / JCM 14584 / KCTC 4019 / B3) TaxID=795797 RepID=D8J3X5_HALJB|nr:cupin domain-containing protein [Halalkalicoccus jeotgali]ADJ15367.1 Cupin 2 conserved barrel domain protein [Halalkalicoccus jeotgali B3]ELY35420.1 Cupin 2 barrel domain-containing protein [Halalkalicoccus jeotgali B3]